MLSFEARTARTLLKFEILCCDVEIKDPEKLQEIVLGEGFSHHLAVASGIFRRSLNCYVNSMIFSILVLTE